MGLREAAAEPVHVVVEASDERAVAEARFVLALDDDTTEFHRRYARPLLGPSFHALRGLRPRRRASVAHALLRGICGQLIQARHALEIERALVRACGEDRRHARSRRSARIAAISSARVQATSTTCAPAAQSARRLGVPGQRERGTERRERDGGGVDGGDQWAHDEGQDQRADDARDLVSHERAGGNPMIADSAAAIRLPPPRARRRRRRAPARRERPAAAGRRPAPLRPSTPRSRGP